jgi:1-acyl-sn-glycerol-3-phosphate acyltransferase
VDTSIKQLGKIVYRRFVWLVWVFTYIVFKPIAALLYNREVEIPEQLRHAEQVPIPAIIISNHKSILDPWLVLTSLPFKTYLRLLPIRIMGATRFKNPISMMLKRIGLVWLIYFMYDVLVIDPDLSFEEKIQSSVEALKHNESLLIFPEGKVCPQSISVNIFKRGVAAIDLKTHTPIIPAAIRFFGKGSGQKCVVRFGKEFCLPFKRFETYPVLDDRFIKGSEYLRRKVKFLFGPVRSLRRKKDL